MKSLSLPKLKKSDASLMSERPSVLKRKISESALPHMNLDLGNLRSNRLTSLPSATTPTTASALIWEFERKKIFDRAKSNRSHLSFAD